MKNTKKWIVILLLLTALLAGATVLYNKLTSEYGGIHLADPPKETAGSDDAAGGSSDAGGTAEGTGEADYSAPDFTVTDAEGNEVRLSDFAGQPVVLNFWATWCYYCGVEMPDFETAFKKYPEVQFLMVNATDGQRETVEIAKEYIRENGYTFDVFFDTEQSAVRAYYVTGFPCTFFIDKNGDLITYANGMLDLATLEKGIQWITEEK